MGAIRLFLAATVAFGHLDLNILRPRGLSVWEPLYLVFNADCAVLAFYMISGFLISTALAHKYSSDAAGIADFYFNRAIRIYSLYLPVALLSFVIVDSTAPSFDAATFLQKITCFTLLGADWLLVSYGAENASAWNALLNPLHQAWTLGPELAFYLLAPWILRSRTLAACALLGSFVVRAALVSKFGFDMRWTYIFAPSTFVFFLMGHVARALADHFGYLRNPAVGYAFALICIVLMVQAVEWDTLHFWAAMTCFAACLPGVFAHTKNNAVLNWLGALSFPVYLVHNIVRMKVEGIVDALPHDAMPAAVIGVLYGLSVLTAAIGAHYLLERPCARLMRYLRHFSLTIRPTFLRVSASKGLP